MDDPTAGDDALIPPDVRRPQRLLDSRRQPDGELSDSDDEGTGGRRDRASWKERDIVNENGGGSPGRKLVGAGIMSSGSASTHTGPSVHTTVARVLSSGIPTMDMDEKPTTEESSDLNSTPKAPDEMTVDAPSVPSTA